MVPPPVDVPMTAAGGLWASAADLARFLQFQLGEGTVDGRTVLDASLIKQMRTVPAPNAGAPAGYALGVARTRWRAEQYLDLFSHGGGGYGFLSDLWWVPQLGLGIAVLTNSSTTTCWSPWPSGSSATWSTTRTAATTSACSPRRPSPTWSSRTASTSHRPSWPSGSRPSRCQRPASKSTRWAGYRRWYRTGQPGAMSPTDPPSRFHVDAGVAYFDASEDGTPIHHRLTEFQPGLFVAENGDTLDLRGPSPRWRGLDLNPVTNGPLPWQWALLALVVVVAAGWLLAGSAASLWRRRAAGRSPTVGESPSGRTGRRLTTTVAAVGALAALATIAALAALPGLVDVGFLGLMPFPLPVRLALHLPLAVTLLTAGLAALLVAGALQQWWTPRIRPRDITLAIALTALAAQLASWHLVA